MTARPQVVVIVGRGGSMSISIRFLSTLEVNPADMSLQEVVQRLQIGVKFKFIVLLPKNGGGFEIWLAPDDGKLFHSHIWALAEGLEAEDGFGLTERQANQYIVGGGGRMAYRLEDRCVVLYGKSYDFGQFDQMLTISTIEEAFVEFLGINRIECRPGVEMFDTSRIDYINTPHEPVMDDVPNGRNGLLSVRVKRLGLNLVKACITGSLLVLGILPIYPLALKTYATILQRRPVVQVEIRKDKRRRFVVEAKDGSRLPLDEAYRLTWVGSDNYRLALGRYDDPPVCYDGDRIVFHAHEGAMGNVYAWLGTGWCRVRLDPLPGAKVKGGFVTDSFLHVQAE